MQTARTRCARRAGRHLGVALLCAILGCAWGNAYGQQDTLSILGGVAAVGDTLVTDVVLESQGEVTGVSWHVVFDSAVLTPLEVEALEPTRAMAVHFHTTGDSLRALLLDPDQGQALQAGVGPVARISWLILQTAVPGDYMLRVSHAGLVNNARPPGRIEPVCEDGRVVVTEAVAEIGGGVGSPGDTVTVSLALASPEPIAGVQAELAWDGTCLTFLDVAVEGRAARLDAYGASQAAGRATLLLADLSGALLLPSGGGAILRVRLRIDGSAEAGGHILRIARVRLADAAGNSVPVVGKPGGIDIVSRPNRPPQLIVPEIVSAAEDSSIGVSFAASDDDDDELVFTLTLGPEWLQVAEDTGVLSGSPGDADVGEQDIGIVVSDGKASVVGISRLVVANRPPSIHGSPPLRTRVGTVYRYAANITNLDGGEVRIETAAEGVILDTSTYEVRWRPQQPGVAAFCLVAVDPNGGEARQPFTVSVEARPQIVIDEILADPPSGDAGDANGDGIRDGSADEFVEIVNTGHDPVDIGGWTLSDDDVSAERRFQFPEGSVLGPGERAVLFGGGEPNGIPGLVFTDDGRIGNGLTNTGDVILLINPASAEPVARVEYHTTRDLNQSLVLMGAEWAAHGDPPGEGRFSPGRPRDLAPAQTGDAGADGPDGPQDISGDPQPPQDGGDEVETSTQTGQQEESVTPSDGPGNTQEGHAGSDAAGGMTPSSDDPVSPTHPSGEDDAQEPAASTDGTSDGPVLRPSGVVINEILADPASGLEGDTNGDGRRHGYEDEFVELWNSGSETADLGGWRLGDDDTRLERLFQFPDNTRLLPDAYLVLFGGGEPQGVAGLVFTDDGRIGDGLSNAGDCVVLVSAGGTDTLTTVPYEKGRKGVSWARDDAGDLIPHNILPDDSGLYSPGGARPPQISAAQSDTTGKGETPVGVPEGDRDLQQSGSDSTGVLPSQDEPDTTGKGETPADSTDAREAPLTPGADSTGVSSLPSPPGSAGTEGGPPGRPPCFLSAPDTLAVAELRYLYCPRADDPDGGLVRIEPLTLPDWLVWDGGAVKGVPLSTGRWEIALLADDSSERSEQRFWVHVRPAPRLKVTEIMVDPPTDTNGDGALHPMADQFIELLNEGGHPVDLSGWQLGDDDGAPYRFPDGAILSPGDRLTLFGGGVTELSLKRFAAGGRIGDGLDEADRLLLLVPSGLDTLLDVRYTGGKAGASLVPDLGRPGRWIAHTYLSSMPFSPGLPAAGYAPEDSARVSVGQPEAPAVSGIHSLRPSPNPFNGHTAIGFWTSGGTVRVTVYNLVGQRLRELVCGDFPPGYHRTTWDALDHLGRRAGTGVYLIRIRSCTDDYAVRVLLLR